MRSVAKEIGRLYIMRQGTLQKPLNMGYKIRLRQFFVELNWK
jgi:hypothetical protein